jgi:hypothetical protein
MPHYVEHNIKAIIIAYQLNSQSGGQDYENKAIFNIIKRCNANEAS